MEDKKGIITGEVNDANEHEIQVIYKKSEHHRHHSHHSHHHGHRHRRKKDNNNSVKKRKFREFLDRYRKQLWIIFSIALLTGLLIILALFIDNKDKFGEDLLENNSPLNVTNQSIQLELPLFTDKLTIVSPAIVDFMDEDNKDSVKDIYNDHKSMPRLDVALPVEILYNVKGLPEDYNITSSKVEVSEFEDFSSPLVFELEGNKNIANVYFLKTNTKYFYRVTLNFSNDQAMSTQGTFVTEDTPRTMKIDGAVNVRDIGGWKTLNGKRIRQGLLYRGSELDGAVDAKYSITPKGVNDMINILGIKSDFDLRSPDENKNGIDALGSKVKHNYYSLPMYTGIFNNAQKEKLRKLFIDLADENNYPIYLHCTYGLDRTGVACYLLEALLGLSDQDLLKEYELSAMYHGGVNDEEMSDFIENIKYLDGATTQDKVEGFLLSIGVTQSEISNIRNIFLEN